jgi:hypothetical protein
MARLTADSIDVGPLQARAPLAKGETKRSSLKSLERALTTLVSPDEARRLTGPLVGIYELRLADAHLPSTDIGNSYALAGIDPAASTLRQGMQMMDRAARTLEEMSSPIEEKAVKEA